jgi:RNA polymerase sigma factor (sigma-70 family)
MNGGRPEFERFFRANYRRLLLIVVVLANGQVPEAEDALQGALIAADRRWDSISYPQAWICRVAYHNLLRARQAQQRETPVSFEAGSGEPSPVTGQEIWEQQEWVTEILKLLSPAEREVMALILDGLPPAEIGRLLGKTSPAVRQNLRAARRRLKEHLADPNDAEFPQRRTGRRPDER